MKGDYIITSSARTMLEKESTGSIFHLLFVADQSQIQELSQLVHHSLLVAYHAYKVAENGSAGRDPVFTTKILIEMQFFHKQDALTFADLLAEKGFHAQILNDARLTGKNAVFEKGDLFSNTAL